MKTFFLFLLTILTSFVIHGQTNVYYPLPTSNTVWRQYDGGFDCGFCQDYQDFINGDTIIGGKSYQKIQRSGVTLATTYPGFCTNIVVWVYDYYKGAYRNDSINKKVYYFPPEATSDTLLYDFNLNIFDTLPQSFVYDPTITGITYVNEIDSVLIGLNYHKRFGFYNILNHTNSGYLIEGIGSTYGLFNRIYPLFECGPSLTCVTEDDVTVYYESGSCELVSDGKLGANKPFFQINPNPISEFARVNFLPSSIPINISITDILGIEKLKIEKLNDGDRINLTNLQQGLYLYVAVQGPSIISTGKLMKIN